MLTFLQILYCQRSVVHLESHKMSKILYILCIFMPEDFHEQVSLVLSDNMLHCYAEILLDWSMVAMKPMMSRHFMAVVARE